MGILGKLLLGITGLGLAGSALLAMPKAGAASFILGNDTSIRSNLDSYSNFLVFDGQAVVANDGYITDFSYYAANNNVFRFVIIDADDIVQWVSEPITPSGVGVFSYDPGVPLAVAVGDKIGLYFAQSGTIPFSIEGSGATWTSADYGPPSVGQTLSFENTTQGRKYSFVANGYSVTTTSVVVSPQNMNGWVFTQETVTGAGNFETGPAVPPSGTGSAQFIVDSTGSELLATAQYQGTKLSDITALSYSTYRTSGNDNHAVSLQFNIDSDLSDDNGNWQGTLIFEPNYSDEVESGQWQTWNAMSQGKWWATTSPISGKCSEANPCSWSELLGGFPQIGIHATLGGIGFKAGEGWADGFEGNVDNFLIGVNGITTKFDFEPIQQLPTDLQAPEVTSLAFDGFTLSVTASDSGHGDSIIASAEFQIDGGSWTGNTMSAADGAFDEATEELTSELGKLKGGSHEICVRALDSAGNLSAVECIVYDQSASTRYEISGNGTVQITGTQGRPDSQFNLRLDADDTGLASGEFVWRDRMTKQNCSFTDLTDFSVNQDGAAEFTASGPCGVLLVTVTDNGNPGRGKDIISIDGVSYPLSGGNIRMVQTGIKSK